MNNLKQSKPPSPERSFASPHLTNEPIGIVKKALAKFCTMKEYESIISGHRRSDITDEALIADFKLCDIPYHHVTKDYHYQKALTTVTDMFKPDKLYRPVHYMDLQYYPWTLSTSVEAPFSTDSILRNDVQQRYRKGILSDSNMTTRNLWDHVQSYNRPIVHMIKEGQSRGDQFLYWNTAHARSHLVLIYDVNKVRMVHGVPKLTLQIELMLLWPYFNFLRKGTTPIAWGYETVTGGIYRIYNEASAHTYPIQTWLAIDWRMFDKLVRYTIIDDVHLKWQSFMRLDSGYTPTHSHPHTTISPSRIQNLWKHMSKAVKFTPVRLPDGSEYKRIHSTIASGLLQTQVLDSWINAIMLLTCLSALGIEISTELFLKVLGDDSLVGLKELIPEEQFDQFLLDLASEAKQRFGAILNVKKSRISNKLQGLPFLGYTFNFSIPSRDPLALLAQLAFPERGWTIDTLAARAVGICYASHGQSKLVYNVCKDVYHFCVNVAKATPDPKGYSMLQYLMTVTTIDVNTFPTFEALSANLLNPSRDTKLDDRFWPPEVFLQDNHCKFFFIPNTT